MALRFAELEPADQYFLDGAHENDELDGTSYLTLRLFGDRDELHTIIKPEPIPLDEDAIRQWFEINPCLNGWRDRYRINEVLTNVADRILLGLEPAEAGGLIWVEAKEMPRLLLQTTEAFAYMAYDDETTGGAMLNWHYGGVDYDGEPHKRVKRRVYAPRFIRKYVHDQRETATWRGHVNRMRRRSQMVRNDLIRDTTSEIEAMLKRQHAVEAQRRWDALIERNREETVPGDGPLVRLKKGACGWRKRRNKIMRRAASTAVAVLGQERVSALAHGNAIEITAPADHLKFVVQSRGNLAQCGHGALMVAVKDIAGSSLAELCVFFQETPGLDQVTAISLFVESGEAKAFLDAANVTFVTEAGREHPLFANRMKLYRAGDLPPNERVRVVDRDTGRRLRRHDRQRDFQREYWAATGSLWIEAMCTQVLPTWALAKPMIEIVRSMSQDTIETHNSEASQ